MVQITDREVYKALGISDNRTPFEEFFYTGILRLKNLENDKLPARPYYIIELKGGKDLYSEVAVFDAKPEYDNKHQPVLDENGNWVAYKNYRDVVKSNDPVFSDKTMLSRLANSIYGNLNDNKVKKHKVREYDLPLYTTRLEVGINTFTKKEGVGFKDYETDLDGNIRYKVKPTGVFIGLDSIKDWSAPAMRPKDVLKHIKLDEARKQQSNPFFIAEW